MKTNKASNVWAVIFGVAAFLLLAICALGGIVTSHAALAMDWLSLTGLVLGAAVVVGLLCWFFNSISNSGNHAA